MHPKTRKLAAIVRRAVDDMKAAGATAIDVAVPDLAAQLMASNLLVQELKFYLGDYLKSAPGSPVKSVEELLASGLHSAQLQGIPEGRQRGSRTTTRGARTTRTGWRRGRARPGHRQGDGRRTASTRSSIRPSAGSRRGSEAIRSAATPDCRRRPASRRSPCPPASRRAASQSASRCWDGRLPNQRCSGWPTRTSSRRDIAVRRPRPRRLVQRRRRARTKRPDSFRSQVL